MQVAIPLTAALLCLDCEAVFETHGGADSTTCPKCASKATHFLVKWLTSTQEVVNAEEAIAS